MQAPLSGRHALVTGGSRGIGRAVAAAVTGAGATVTILGRNESALRSALEQKTAAHYVLADVTRGDECRAAIADAEAKGGPIDVLVANAGGAESAPFAKSEEQLFRRMIDLNLMSIVHVAQPVIGGMVARGFGRIVAVASLAGLKGYAYVSAYCAAKHAAVGLVRAMAAEYASSDVIINAVCPGYTDTDLVDASVDRIVQKTGRNREAALASLLAADAQDRLIAPAEVAAAVMSLCLPDRSATGEAVPVLGKK
ncbi:MAG TPA: SDR family oxidoreductase [Xanthobacteraceae bacterium]|jgi:NAD(P)-dependent dehydrogenase (short-subunit alcohol dehydrogenase family)